MQVEITFAETADDEAAYSRICKTLQDQFSLKEQNRALISKCMYIYMYSCNSVIASTYQYIIQRLFDGKKLHL